MLSHPDFAGKLHLAFTGGRLERESGKRRDAGWRAALEADDSSRVYVMAGEHVVLKKSPTLADPLFSFAEVAAFGATQERVLLGLHEGTARFAISIDKGLTDTGTENSSNIDGTPSDVTTIETLDRESLGPNLKLGRRNWIDLRQ